MATRLLERASRELGQHAFEQAARSLTSLLALAPDNLEANRMLGLVAQRLGDHARAVACFRKVLGQHPDDPALRTGLGISLCELGDGDAAAGELQVACRLAPDSASSWFNLGELLARQGRAGDAQRALRRALELDPGQASARLALARVLANMGQAEAAAAEFREVLRRDADNAEAWFGLSYLNVACFEPEDAVRIEGTLARGNQAPREQELLGFALAKARESQGEYLRAFDAFRVANELGRQRVHWNAAAAHARVEAIQRAFPVADIASTDADAGREVVLVVSMPRSGSTLVEQMLASHPDVAGAGELQDLARILDVESRRRNAAFPAWVGAATAGDWQRLGQEYLTRTAPWRIARPRLVDKNPENWLLVGAVLAMLPAARVIVVRRDPVETCLACYRQCFGTVRGYACDLGETADYCIDFLRLTRYWLDQFPERVLDLQYEALVAEPEKEIRRLLDFCALSFDPACLESHRTQRNVQSLPSAAQVRKPLQRGTARAACYGDRLDALRARLRVDGVHVEGSK